MEVKGPRKDNALNGPVWWSCKTIDQKAIAYCEDTREKHTICNFVVGFTGYKSYTVTSEKTRKREAVTIYFYLSIYLFIIIIIIILFL